MGSRCGADGGGDKCCCACPPCHQKSECGTVFVTVELLWLPHCWNAIHPLRSLCSDLATLNGYDNWMTFFGNETRSHQASIWILTKGS